MLTELEKRAQANLTFGLEQSRAVAAAKVVAKARTDLLKRFDPSDPRIEVVDNTLRGLDASIVQALKLSGLLESGFQMGSELVNRDNPGLSLRPTISPWVLSAGEQEALSRIAGIEPRLKARIKEEIEISLAQGAGTAEMRDRIFSLTLPGSAFRDAKYSAERTARTVSNSLVNAGKQASYEAYAQEYPELNIRQQWVNVSDMRTSDICRALTGQIRELGKPFEGGGWSGMRPPAHINCRSTIVPVTGPVEAKPEPKPKKVEPQQSKPTEPKRSTAKTKAEVAEEYRQAMIAKGARPFAARARGEFLAKLGKSDLDGFIRKALWAEGDQDGTAIAGWLDRLPALREVVTKPKLSLDESDFVLKTVTENNAWKDKSATGNAMRAALATAYLRSGDAGRDLFDAEMGSSPLGAKLRKRLGRPDPNQFQAQPGRPEAERAVPIRTPDYNPEAIRKHLDKGYKTLTNLLPKDEAEEAMRTLNRVMQAQHNIHKGQAPAEQTIYNDYKAPDDALTKVADSLLAAIEARKAPFEKLPARVRRSLKATFPEPEIAEAVGRAYGLMGGMFNNVGIPGYIRDPAHDRGYAHAYHGVNLGSKPGNWRNSAPGERKDIALQKLQGLIWHETAHFIEKNRPELAMRAKEWIAVRAQGNSIAKLKDITGLGYKDDELAFPDHFIDHYAGKIYGHEASEVPSMGFEMFSNRDMLSQLIHNDAEHLLMTLASIDDD